MGTEYYLIDTTQKISYDLGKGSWWSVNWEYIKNKEILAEELLGHVFVSFGYKEGPSPELEKYVKEYLAPDLFNLFEKSNIKDLHIINDCTDDLSIIRCKKYKCVGNRYAGSQEEKQEDLEYENRHLTNNRHKQEDYVNDPNWEKF